MRLLVEFETLWREISIMNNLGVRSLEIICSFKRSSTTIECSHSFLVLQLALNISLFLISHNGLLLRTGPSCRAHSIKPLIINLIGLLLLLLLIVRVWNLHMIRHRKKLTRSASFLLLLIIEVLLLNITRVNRLSLN